MKILIIGAGAIGGSLACYLARQNCDITVLESRQEVCDLINENGLTLKTSKGVITAKVKAMTSLTENNNDFRYCFSATRAYHLQSAVKSVLDKLPSETLIISMNNGICLDALVEVVGKKRAVCCSINYGVGIEEAGKYFIKIEGGLVIGMADGYCPQSLIELNNLLNNAVGCAVTDNIIGALYSKMLINACITSVAVLSGQTLGEILKRRAGKEIFLSIIKEGVLTAQAANINIPKYNGKLNYYTLTKETLPAKIYRKLYFAVLTAKYKKRTSATLEALKRGVSTETEFYNGYIVKLGKSLGIDTPVNRKICEKIKEIEKDLTLISPNNIEKILKD